MDAAAPVKTIIRIDTYPGIDDPVYQKRRQEIEEKARDYQEGSPLPELDYTEEENKTWATVTQKMDTLHKGRACEGYLRGKDILNWPRTRLPQLSELDARMKAADGFRISPVEGWIDSWSYFTHLSKKRMFCSQYIRHASQPEYTPEPDIVHEVVGHLPLLSYNNEFTEFNILIGLAGSKATPEEIKKLERLYWFTGEFGLIRENGELRIYGASPCGSVGEIQNCLTDKVEHADFLLDEVLDTEFDIYGFQKKLFVIKSYKDLLKQAEPFLRAIIQR
jgi:phenylalanine-4-hydroxylase